MHKLVATLQIRMLESYFNFKTNFFKPKKENWTNPATLRIICNCCIIFLTNMDLILTCICNLHFVFKLCTLHQFCAMFKFHMLQNSTTIQTSNFLDFIYDFNFQSSICVCAWFNVQLMPMLVFCLSLLVHYGTLFVFVGSSWNIV